MRFNVKGMPKQIVVSVFLVCNPSYSHNNSINPVITDMNQSVLADIKAILRFTKNDSKKICKQEKLNV